MSKRQAVAGFAFNTDASKVVLTLKDRPSWQAGFKNAIGGQVELGEEPIDAMVRECEEETSLIIPADKWQPVATIEMPDVDIHFFKSFSDISNAKQQTGETEEISIENVADIASIKTIANFQWLILLALDERNVNANIKYKARQ